MTQLTARSRLLEWLESGRQVGKRFTLVRDAETFWGAVAVQKVGARYVAFFWAATGPRVRMEEAHRQVKEDFERAEDSLAFLAERTGQSVDDMTPLKGARLFQT